MRIALQRLLTFLAFALALVVPLRAQAAIVQVCEDDVVSVVPPPAEPSCAVVTSVDGVTGETSAAPICDPRGMSAIAPPRILPVADARIDAAPGCDSSEISPLAAPGSQDHTPVGPQASPALHAVLIPTLSPAPAQPSLLLPTTPVEGGPRAGIERSIYHPPR